MEAANLIGAILWFILGFMAGVIYISDNSGEE
jgi:hypothetical protein